VRATDGADHARCTVEVGALPTFLRGAGLVSDTRARGDRVRPGLEVPAAAEPDAERVTQAVADDVVLQVDAVVRHALRRDLTVDDDAVVAGALGAPVLPFDVELEIAVDPAVRAEELVA